MSQEVVANFLVDEHGLSADRAQLLARLSGGRFGWAVTAATGAEVLEERDRQLARLQEVVGGGLEVRFEYARDLAAQFRRDREVAVRVLGEWLQWWRDLLMLKEEMPELVVNVDRQEELERMVHRLRTREIVAVVRELVATVERLEQNANPRLALEVLMLALPRADEVPA